MKKQIDGVENFCSGSGVATDETSLYALALSMWKDFDSQDVSRKLAMGNLGWALFAQLAGQYRAASEEARMVRGGLAPWQERLARDMIEASLDSEVSMEALSEACGVSRAHFARAFRRTMGLPPHQWLLSRRVERAKELLRRDDFSISLVADICGFADQSHLSRVFRKFAGVSPSAWRRQNAKGDASHVERAPRNSCGIARAA